MEASSVASFSKLALDLMHWGAPFSLVQRVLAAAQDEVEHAKICFERSATTGARGLALGRMRLPRRLKLHSLSRLVHEVALDGLFNESLSVEILAQAASDDPVLAGIGRQEQGHATLAWDILLWARRAHPRSARRGLKQALARLGRQRACFARLSKGAAMSRVSEEFYVEAFRQTQLETCLKLRSLD
jgi:hypothetical protein